jgi:hypothetical protein
MIIATTELQQQTSPSMFIFRKKYQCWRTSWNITGGQMVPPRRRSLVASLPKNSFWRKEELQLVHSHNPYNSSSMPVRFWEVPKKNKRSILTSCAVRYPERDLNPHSRNGHRILSPACLPFHHPGGFDNGKFIINIPDSKQQRHAIACLCC